MKIIKIKAKSFKDCDHYVDLLLATEFNPVVVQDNGVFSEGVYCISFVTEDNAEIPNEISRVITKTVQL